MMQNYSFSLPRNIKFGENLLQELPLLLPAGCRVLVVSGAHCRRRAADLLPGAVLAPPVRAELPLEDVEDLLELARREKVTAVVAIGGGSVMDAGKAVAALAPLTGSVKEYFYGERKIPGKGLFFAACPTTAGTGAEMTSNSVICDDTTGIKQSLRHPEMTADLALVDPVLTYGSPAEVTASSGFDALVQAVEATISRKANTFTRSISMIAAMQIFENLAGAVEDDPQARNAVAEGSMMTGMAFAQCGLGAVHGIAHPLGSICHVPHGIACAVLFPAVMRRNMPYARILNDMFGEDPLAKYNALLKSCGLPGNFREYGLKPEHYDFIIRNCRSGSMKSNPRDMSDGEVIQLLEKML